MIPMAGEVKRIPRSASYNYRISHAVGPLLVAKEADQRPTLHAANSQSPAYRKLVQLWDQIVVKNGILWRIFEDADGSSSHPQLVVIKFSETSFYGSCTMELQVDNWGVKRCSVS